MVNFTGLSTKFTITAAVPGEESEVPMEIRELRITKEIGRIKISPINGMILSIIVRIMMRESLKEAIAEIVKEKRIIIMQIEFEFCYGSFLALSHHYFYNYR